MSKAQEGMHFYLSDGLGVASSALRLWLIENKWPFEDIYVDHGCDWPETRELIKTTPNLTVIKPNVEGFNDLYEYCLRHKMFPSFQKKWCSDKFKVRPLYQYFKRPCISYIGFTIEEAHRVKNSRESDIFNQFPLISLGWTRQDCIRYIKSKNMSVPIRSGCWFCPNQKKGQWNKLREEHPKLYQKAKDLEMISMEYREDRGKEPFPLSRNGKKLEDITQERQMELFSL